MYRALLLLLFMAPAALAEKAWIGDIPGCTREAAARGAPLPFGCANALNLAAMIYAPDPAADPDAPRRADAAMRAVGRLRAGDVAPLPQSGGTGLGLE